jgi:hypothetical protein
VKNDSIDEHLVTSFGQYLNYPFHQFDTLKCRVTSFALRSRISIEVEPALCYWKSDARLLQVAKRDRSYSCSGPARTNAPADQPPKSSCTARSSEAATGRRTSADGSSTYPQDRYTAGACRAAGCHSPASPLSNTTARIEAVDCWRIIPRKEEFPIVVPESWVAFP